MDKRSLERFKNSLGAKRDDLRRRLGVAKTEGRGPSLGESKDEGDRANASMESEITALQETQAQTLLRAVNGALDRIQNGTFGECIHCDLEISARRLGAIPWTRYCIACQELIDEH
jgi:DnaK suppressor protein